MTRVGAVLAAAADRLRAAGVEAPGTDARRCLAHALGVAPGRLAAMRDEPVPEPALKAFRAMLARRVAREPLSHILGYRDFWAHRFRVTPDVLDPRPETETLVALALEAPFSKVLDLGTGSGAIVISLLAARPQARGVGADISERAVLVAGENAARIGVADRLILPISDWYADIGGRFDLIVSNPPYIAAEEMAGLAPEVRDHEPAGALTDGGDGLAACRAIAAGACDHLVPGGRLLVEIGPAQGAAAAEIFRAAGLDAVAVHPDLDGRDRVVSGRAPGDGHGAG